MDQEQYVHRRKGRYMAQLLEEFEAELEPRLPQGVADAFKALVRRKLNAFATDVTDLLAGGDDTVKNGAAQALEDGLFADTRTTQAKQRGS